MMIIALAGLVLACGQKGPLVLPDAPKHKRSAPAKPGPAATPPAQPQQPAQP
jgi:predicted small lipoprotein YifL